MAAGKTEAVSMKSIPGDITQYLLIRGTAGTYSRRCVESGDKLPSERDFVRDLQHHAHYYSRKSGTAQVQWAYLARRRGWFVTPERLWLDPTQNTNFIALPRRGGAGQKPLLSGMLTTVPVSRSRASSSSRLINLSADPSARYADSRAVCCCETVFARPRAELLQYDLNGSLTGRHEMRTTTSVYTSMHLSFYPTAMPAAQAAQALGVMGARRCCCAV